MSGFTKLKASIIHSTIWQEDYHVRILWISMLAMKDRYGIVEGAIPGLAKAAGITLKECEDGLERLMAPDSYSRTKAHDGRRIEEVDGGWLILNHLKHREPDPRLSATRREAGRKGAAKRWQNHDKKQVVNGKDSKAMAKHDKNGDADTDADTDLFSTVVDDSRPPEEKVSSQGEPPPPLSSSDLTSGTKTKSKSSKSGPVWESYSTAYAKRYGVTPQRNARISKQLCTLIDYIGAELAPKVAAYFLTSNNQWYVKNAHPVDSLLRDCQKLRTEYLTGNRITATQAHEADRIQATGDSWDRVMAKREERRRNGE